MNIFYVDRDPCYAAQFLHDKHVVKMVLESAQILSTVHHRYGSEHAAKVYAPTHMHHPSVLWAGDSATHYRWMFFHFSHLSQEYYIRFGRIHACEDMLPLLEHPPSNMPITFFTPPPLCMPDKYKQDDAVDAYRAYYVGEKLSYVVKGATYWNRWTAVPPPEWVYDGAKINKVNTTTYSIIERR